MYVTRLGQVTNQIWADRLEQGTGPQECRNCRALGTKTYRNVTYNILDNSSNYSNISSISNISEGCFEGCSMFNQSELDSTLANRKVVEFVVSSRTLCCGDLLCYFSKFLDSSWICYPNYCNGVKNYLQPRPIISRHLAVYSSFPPLQC